MKKLIIMSILLFFLALSADEYFTVPELTEKEMKILSSFNLKQLDSKAPLFIMFNADIRFIYNLQTRMVFSNEEKAQVSFLKRLYGLSENASLIEVYFTQLKILQIRVFILKRVIKIRGEKKEFSSEKERKGNSEVIKRYKRLVRAFTQTIEGSARHFKYTKKDW